MSLPRYPEYKDSGVEWLGEIPSHWSIRRLQDIAQVINGYPFDSKLFCEEGGYPLIRIRDLDADETAIRYAGDFVPAAAVMAGDVLIGMDGEFNVGRWLGSEQALLNQRMCCVRPPQHALATFLRHALPAPLRAINDVTYSTTVKHLSSFQVKSIRLALPEDAELEEIALFLDRETAKIDALIAEQEKLLALLAEKRQATISHAVTRGLDPNVPMKDSGIPWLGEVPAHWGVSPLKYISRIGNGSTPNRDNPDYWSDTGFPWLNSSVVNQDEVTEADRFVTEFALKECHLPVIRPPAILVGITGQGKTRGMVAPLMFEATISQHLAYVTPEAGRLEVAYLLRVLEIAYGTLRTDSESAGSTKGAITCDQLSRFTIPLPPLDEQGAIAKQIDNKAAYFEKLASDSRKAIALLKERRSALIAAAVTGQIDVRGFVEAQAA